MIEALLGRTWRGTHGGKRCCEPIKEDLPTRAGVEAPSRSVFAVVIDMATSTPSLPRTSGMGRASSRPSTARLDQTGAAIWAVVSAGVLLRLAAYLANRSLFIDEAALALSIRDRALPELLSRPLDYAQTAPPGYLALLELSTRALGDSEYGLRLPALIAGILAVGLFAVLAWQYLPRAGALLAVALLAFGHRPVYFSGEAKQYAFDLLAAVALLLVTFHALGGDADRRRLKLAALVGTVAVTVSQPAVFLVSGIGAAGLAWLLRQRRPADARRFALLTVAPWVIASVAVLLWYGGAYTPESRAYMRFYWKLGFFPLVPTDNSEALWLPVAALSFEFDPLSTLIPLAPLALAVVGARALWSTRPLVLLAVLAPVMITLGASAARAYPFGGNSLSAVAFDGRVLLFLLPGALLLIGAGAGAAWERTRGRGRVAAYAVLAALVGSAVVQTVSRFPYSQQESRQILREVARRRAPGEAIFVDYRSQHAFLFYAPKFRLDDEPVIWGGCHRADPQANFREWEALRPHGRVWYIALHPLPTEEQLYHSYFDRTAVTEVALRGKRSTAYRLRFRTDPGVSTDALPGIPSRLSQRDLTLSCEGPWQR